jgi:hypothetical protein
MSASHTGMSASHMCGVNSGTVSGYGATKPLRRGETLTVQTRVWRKGAAGIGTVKRLVSVTGNNGLVRVPICFGFDAMAMDLTGRVCAFAISEVTPFVIFPTNPA